MISRKSFQDAPHGRRFLPVFDNPKYPAKHVLDLLNKPRTLDVMAYASTHMKNRPMPALAVIVEELEEIEEIDKFFRSRASSETLPFRQFVGMAVRLAMEDKGFTKTGMKGNFGAASKWFTRAEIFEPSSKSRSEKK